MPAPTDKPAAARWERFAAPVLLAAALLVLAAPLADPSLQLAARDDGRMLYPLKHLIADELAHGRLPAWNPFVGLGEPLLSNVVSGALDPLNLLGVVLPFALGFKAMTLACYLVAALGVWLWARGRQLSPAAAATAALAFVLSGYATGIASNLIYLRGLAFAALFVAAFERAVRTGGAWRIGAAALAWALILWGGEPQSWLVAFVFAFVLALSEPGAERRTVLIRTLAIGWLGALLSAPVLVPAAIEFPRTDRGLLGEAAVVTQWWFAPSRVAELAFPSLLRSPEGVNLVYQALYAAGRPAPWVPSTYLGVVALLLAGLGVRGRGGRGALALALLAFWFATGPALGAATVSSALPIWRSFQYPEKLVGFLALATAMLAGLGAGRLEAGLSKPTRLAMVAGLLGLLAAAVGLSANALAASLPPEAASVLRDNLRRGALHAGLALAASAVVLVLLRRRIGLLVLSLAALAGADLLAAHSLAPSLLPARVLDVKSPLADWIHANDPLARVATPFEYSDQGPASAANQYALWSKTLVPLWNVEARVGNMGWYGGLASGRYRALRQAGMEGLRYLEAAAAHGTGYVVVPGALENLKKIGVDGTDVVATDPSVPASLVRVTHRPFAYFAERPERADAEAALAGVLAPGFAAGPRTLVESTEPLPAVCEGAGEVSSSCSAATRCALAVQSPCERLLVVNLPPAPGWTFSNRRSRGRAGTGELPRLGHPGPRRRATGQPELLHSGPAAGAGVGAARGGAGGVEGASFEAQRRQPVARRLTGQSRTRLRRHEASAPAVASGRAGAARLPPGRRSGWPSAARGSLPASRGATRRSPDSAPALPCSGAHGSPRPAAAPPRSRLS
ncbi:MAG: hypothetical protein QM765_06765 [Myxococcales bacterium]